MGEIVNLNKEVPWNFWEGRLLTNEWLTAMNNDPALWAEQAKKIANMDVNLRNGGLAWQEGMQLSFKGIGKASGVPAQVASTIGDLIVDVASGIPFDQKEFNINLAKAGIAQVTTMVSAVPIVGPILKAIGDTALMLWDLARIDWPQAVEYLPPFQDYSDELDEYVVNNQVMPALETLDWTGFFLPRYSGTWAAQERKSGWMMRGKGGGGVGFMPGTQQISGIIQTYFYYKSVRKGFQIAESRNQGSFYPSASQILTAIQAQVQKPQTQLYNVDTHKIEKRWREYFEEATELGKGIFERKKWAIADNGLSGLTEEQSQVLAGALMSPFHVSSIKKKGEKVGRIGGVGTLAWTPWAPGGESVFHAIIKPWCERIRRRQLYHIKTIVGTAYTDERQAAFQDQELLLKMRINRTLLLKSPYRRDVNRREMIDRSYREEIFQSLAGSTFSMGVQPSTQQRVLVMPKISYGAEMPQGGSPFEWARAPRTRGSGGKLLFGAAVLGGAGYLAYKKGWI